jgi:hypothetical protein
MSRHVHITDEEFRDLQRRGLIPLKPVLSPPEARSLPEGKEICTKDQKPATTKQNKRSNHWEREFESLLRLMLPNATIEAQPHPPLVLAYRCSYTPDFRVTHFNKESNVNHIDYYEVKGYMRDDANVKLKVATQTFGGRQVSFYLVTKISGRWWVRKVPRIGEKPYMKQLLEDYLKLQRITCIEQ